MTGARTATKVIDNGCEFHSDCFTGPYPKRIEGTRQTRQIRDRAIMELYQEGLTMREIAETFGIHKSTVQRALASK